MSAAAHVPETPVAALQATRSRSWRQRAFSSNGSLTATTSRTFAPVLRLKSLELRNTREVTMSESNTAVLGTSRAGIGAHGASDSSTGVLGKSESGFGVHGISDGGPGGVFESRTTHRSGSCLGKWPRRRAASPAPAANCWRRRRPASRARVQTLVLHSGRR